MLGKPNERARVISAKTRDVERRVLRALRAMRGGQSFSAAAKREKLKPETFRRHAGSALRRKHPGGRFYVTRTDSLRREMTVQTESGPERLPLRGLKQARLVSAHANAMARFNRGDLNALREFEGRTIRVGGRTVLLLTDPARLKEIGEADAYHPDSLYDEF